MKVSGGSQVVNKARASIALNPIETGDLEYRQGRERDLVDSMTPNTWMGRSNSGSGGRPSGQKVDCSI